MRHILFIVSLCFLISCQKTSQKENAFTGADGEIRLITLAPGHFHAALLQKRSLNQINKSVYVYAPEGKELETHLAYIKSYNSRDDDPTDWQEEVYTGEDFFNRMLAEKKGNVVVLAGNNRLKTDYMLHAAENGINVLADKPMAIDFNSFRKLEKAFETAKEKSVVIYDLMTERYVDYNIVNKLLMQNNDLFGEILPGSPEEPAVTLNSVHHFYKEVSGKPLIRPAWYYDVSQQGEGLVDVTTHLIDLVFWKCFPESPIDYKTDIRMIEATHWPTYLTKEEFYKSTLYPEFPDYLPVGTDSLLEVYSNGNMLYTLRDIHVGISVSWNYQAPIHTGDTHTSVFRGSKATLYILQGEEQQYIPKLYIEKKEEISEAVFEKELLNAVEKLKPDYSVEIVPTSDQKRELIISPKIKSNHEDHFSMVASKYFDFLVKRDIPEWEIKNMLAKYFITTKALEMAKENRNNF